MNQVFIPLTEKKHAEDVVRSFPGVIEDFFKVEYGQSLGKDYVLANLYGTGLGPSINSDVFIAQKLSMALGVPIYTDSGRPDSEIITDICLSEYINGEFSRFVDCTEDDDGNLTVLK